MYILTHLPIGNLLSYCPCMERLCCLLRCNQRSTIF